MRNIWLLPDRDQVGQIVAVENGVASTSSALLPLSDLPPELVLGVPEELLRSKAGQFFIYGQFVRLANGSRIFCLSAPTDRDVSGRITFTTNLQILSPGEPPAYPPVICVGIPSDEQASVNQIVNADSSTYAPIQQMLEAVDQQPRAKSFSSERLITAHFKPAWMPSKKKRTLIRSIFAAVVLAIMTLIAFCVAH